MAVGLEGGFPSIKRIFSLTTATGIIGGLEGGHGKPGFTRCYQKRSHIRTHAPAIWSGRREEKCLRSTLFYGSVAKINKANVIERKCHLRFWARCELLIHLMKVDFLFADTERSLVRVCVCACVFTDHKGCVMRLETFVDFIWNFQRKREQLYVNFICFYLWTQYRKGSKSMHCPIYFLYLLIIYKRFKSIHTNSAYME